MDNASEILHRFVSIHVQMEPMMIRPSPTACQKVFLMFSMMNSVAKSETPCQKKKISTFLTQAIASADKQTNRPESESGWRRYTLRPASSYLGNPQRERRKAIEQIPFLATHIPGPKSTHPISRSVDTFGGREAAGVI